MSKHKLIEEIVTETCAYYEVNWRKAFTGKAGVDHKARVVIVQLVCELISESGGHEYLNLTRPVFLNYKNCPTPDGYEQIRNRISKVAA